jgi:hypothetical protein
MSRVVHTTRLRSRSFRQGVDSLTGSRCSSWTRSRRRLQSVSRDEAEGLLWRYQWDDEGAVLAKRIRAEFAANVARGEASFDAAAAALHIAAEDDALMSITGVPLPVEPYLDRLDRLADDVTAALAAVPREDAPAVLATVSQCLSVFRPPQAPTIGANTRVDMPGVHETPGHSYMHTLLTKKCGSPPLLAILYGDVWRRLLARAAVTFPIALRLPSSSCDRPELVALPQLRGLGGTGGSIHLNTWPAYDALTQLLRHLKRAYWPVRWDTALDDPSDGPYGSGGGFLAAAASALGDDDADAATTAIARTAAHRLARGIWTSSGGGDIRRAVAACERLVLVLDQRRRAAPSDGSPATARLEAAHARERRDLGALLLLAGDVGAARPHIQAAAQHRLPDCTPAERAVLDRLAQALPELERTMGPPPTRRKNLPW